MATPSSILAWRIPWTKEPSGLQSMGLQRGGHIEVTFTGSCAHMYKYDVVVAHLEPDILKHEVKWALGSITANKASGGDRIPAERFRIIKDDALKCCTQDVSKFGKLNSGHRTGTGKFSFQSQRRKMQKNVQITVFVLISHASKVMLKIFQARLQQYVN